ncbi:MAG: DUF4249 family protein [Bacteroidota bacterium]
MWKKRHYLCVSLLLSLFLMGISACLDRIELDAEAAEERPIVIQGKLILGTPSRIQLSIGRLSGLRTDELPIPVDVQEVVLEDENGNRFLINYTSGLDISYPIDASTGIEMAPGKSYRLSVVTLEGETIQSTFEVLPETVSADSLGFSLTKRTFLNELENEVEADFVSFNLFTGLRTNDGNLARFKWDFKSTYVAIDVEDPNTNFPNTKICYIDRNINPNKITVFDGNEFTGNRLENFSLLEQEVDSKFAYGYYLIILKEALSAGAYAYWNEVRQVLDRNGNFFETPAGEIQSNFTNTDRPEQIIYGYFYATQVDTTYQHVGPADVGTPVDQCRLIANYDELPLQCRDCLTIPRSTTIKPPYWK